MTNAEKYLKDGVDEVAFAGELADLFLSKMEEKYPYAVDTFIDYFHDLAEPQLTEDERVILRNMENRKYIYRDEYGHLYVYRNKGRENYHVMEYLQIEMYDHLFQFIKERRRILNKGVVKK